MFTLIIALYSAQAVNQHHVVWQVAAVEFESEAKCIDYGKSPAGQKYLAKVHAKAFDCIPDSDLK